MIQCSGSIVMFALLALLGVPVPLTAQVILGDATGDGDVDLLDFGVMQQCFERGDETPLGCEAFDFDGIAPINLSDFSYFWCAVGGVGNVLPAVLVDPVTSPTNEPFITLTGVTAGAARVRVNGEREPASAVTSQCTFSVAVALEPNAVNQLFVTALYGEGIPSAPLPVTVIQDQSPPALFIDFPSHGAVITTATTDVSGRVGDLLSGFQGLSVMVNGLQAEVDVGIGTNGSFFARNVPLQIGANVLTAVAHDVLGNKAVREITVDRVKVPPDAPLMMVVSGNGQKGVVYDPLADPIVVGLTNSKGQPLAGKLVTFRVTHNDGRLVTLPFGGGGTMLQAFTDAEGEARAFWHLGGTAGCGNNRVEVTSESVVGTTVFCASASPRPAAQINVGSGSNQQAEAGGPAPEPLRAWVNDACNPVVDVPVTFTVVSGQGKVNGQDAVTVLTGITGHAAVDFNLGPGHGNNVVRADFPGNPNDPASFFIFGIMRDVTQPTRFGGMVLDNGGLPIEGAKCTLVVDGVGLFTSTNVLGQFLIDNIDGAGQADLVIDGRTATAVGGESILPCITSDGAALPNPCLFPFLHYEPVIIPNAANSLPNPILLPRLNPMNRVPYRGTEEVELTVEGVEGLKMTVAAATRVVLSNGSCVDTNDPQCIGDPMCNAEFGGPCVTLALNHVHHDDVPMLIPDGAAPQFAWTLQPSGATFDPPIAITYPNMSGLPPGAIAYFLSFNHDTHRFEIIASGQVSGDGMVITTDPGVGITNAGWGCNCPPYSVTGQCCHSEGAEGGGFDCCLDPCPPCTEGCDGDCAPIICVPGDCNTCQDSVCVPINNGMPCSGDKCEVCVFGECVSTCGACETCQNGMCAPCGQCAACINTVCVSLGTECGTGCCPLDQVCCAIEGLGHACLPAGSQCCTVQGHPTACQPPNSVCCSPGGCAPDGHICCPDGVHQCASFEQCCFNGPCCDDPAAPVCCSGNCYPPGTECCPDGLTCVDPGGASTHCCNDAAPNCCGTGCIASGDGCCADGSGFCEGGVCCSNGCNPPGTSCCPNDVVCEPPTSQCCGSGCAPAGQCCNGQPMASGQHCCPDVGFGVHPCNSNQTCCAGGCCSPGTKCCDGVCAPEVAACCPLGGSCPPGQECCGSICFSPATHNCCSASSSGICALSTPVCCPPGGTLSHCCGPNSQCCGSTCCTMNQTCCIGPNGSDCCNPGQACINGVCGLP